MSTPSIQTVALVGSGVIGRAWAFVFARAGVNVRAFDAWPESLKACEKWLDETLASETAEGYMTKDEAAACKRRVTFHTDMAEALKGAGYVQESVRELLDLKQSLYKEMDRLAAPDAVLASSTSALNVEDFTGDLPGAGRCIMAHPFNPPYVLPAVEVLGNRKTTAETIERTVKFLREVGQKPVVMHAFIPGFIGNRLQAAVLREAFHLVEDGVADVEAVDTLLFDALGLRWALFGNFGVNNTNSDKGAADYYQQFAGTYTALSHDMRADPPSFSPEVVAKVDAEIKKLEGGATPIQLCRWRDKMVRNIRRLKKEIPHPGGRV